MLEGEAGGMDDRRSVTECKLSSGAGGEVSVKEEEKGEMGCRQVG